MTGMMTVTEEDILEKVTESSFERGRYYYESRMVESGDSAGKPAVRRGAGQRVGTIPRWRCPARG